MPLFIISLLMLFSKVVFFRFFKEENTSLMSNLSEFPKLLMLYYTLVVIIQPQ